MLRINKKQGDIICQWTFITLLFVSEIDGYKLLDEGITYKVETDEQTNAIIESKDKL